MRLWMLAPGSLAGLALLVALTLTPAAARPQGDAKKQESKGEKKTDPPSPGAVQFFEAKIRPLLAERCYSCHGEKKQRADLRLDSREAMLQGGEGPVIVPGDPAKSLLVKAVRYDDKHLKMPPDKKLTKDQIDDLTQWVKMGAPWPGEDKGTVVRKGEFKITDKDREHWSFKPVKRPAVPPVKNAKWVTSPIDAFVLAGLEAKGLKPAEPAAPQELVRRLYYDLTGLPPTPKEMEDYLADKAPNAYEKLIDRLLESPRYGEKWARHWLDLVRFAETSSYERDNPKPHTWRYRDYVIKSFNQDKPFDRFLKEQLAGDELYPKDAEALVATGYYRLGIWDDEPVDAKQARYDGLDDIVATTGQVFLGLTLDCARCHNHKIDPISQKDYYRFMGFFHNINHYKGGGPTDVRPLLTPDTKKQYELQVKALEEKRNKTQAEITAIEKEFRTALEKANKEKVTARDLDDLHFKFYRDSWTKLPDFSAVKVEETGPVASNLFDIGLRSRDEAFGFVFEGTLIVPESGKYTFFLDSDDGSRLTVAGKVVLEYDGIHGLGKEKKATVDLAKGRLPVKLEYFQNVFGLGLEVAWAGPGFERRSLSAPAKATRTALQDFAKAFAAEGPRLLGKERVQQYQQLKKSLAALNKEQPVVEMALCVTEAGANAPDTFVLARGNPHAPAEKVTPGFPEVVSKTEAVIPAPPAGATSSGRRSVLANWLADKDNPLTARVITNRIWQNHFGRGIVRTPNDFGFQGTRPTHPELLDWLASELVSNGWRFKPLHKTILMSSTYRMSSRGNAKALAADPANDLLWRFDMRRLTAEEIRDSILAVSGNLNTAMYGPGVYPEIPKEVLAGQSVPGRGWGKSSPEEQARRSIYIHVKRSLLYPLLESFDVAETDRSVPLRFATTQPTQALAMLNSDYMNKQAAIFGDRLRREAKELTGQVRLGLMLATQRTPTEAEIRRGVDLVTALQKEDGLSATAALNGFCLVALNLNEFMYLD